MSVSESHNEAMDLAEAAFHQRRRGNMKASIGLFEKALASELEAVAQLEESGQLVEPTYSVLCRSAGTLALDCNQLGTAEEITRRALDKGSSQEIEDELQDLLDQIARRTK